jgi:tetratricopeptide (TPR) repeat protein
VRYRAFISYSHADDRWASWLHRSIEGYGVPRRLRGTTGQFGPLPDRLTPLFRDREDLASAGELGPQIRAALADSEALIVVCSPDAARSRWVNEEVVEFKRTHGASRVYCLIVAGEPHAGDENECFPPAVRFDLDADGNPGSRKVEPIGADVRPGKDGKSLARLKLLSGLLGVELDTLRQRDLQRRQRRLTAVTALAVGVTLVTTILAVQAVIARKDAERRQKQAENLVAFMLGDLYDKLTQVQRTDIMAAVNDQAMKYFESLPVTDVTDEVLEQRAKALEKIGTVRLDQGSVAAAAESYRAALPLAEALAKSRHADTARQAAHARILSYLGMTHWYAGELDEALHQFESARRVLDVARAGNPGDLVVLARLVEVENNVGHILESRGDLDGAEARYRAMLSLARQLVGAKPGDTDSSVSLGLAHNNLGKLALMRGDLAAAVAEYSADDAIETQIWRRNPKDNNQAEKVAITRAALGRTLAMTGDVGTGAQLLREAVDIVTRLRGVDPSNTGFQEDIGLYATQLGRVYRLLGELDRAAELTTTALAVFESLTTQDATNSMFRREFAEAKLERAEQLSAAGRLDAASELGNDALAILAPLAAAHPDDRPTVLATAGTQSLLGRLASDPQAARQLHLDALTLAQGAKDGKDDPRLLMLQVDALLALGRKQETGTIVQQLWRNGCRDPGLLALLERHHIAYPANPEFAARLRAARENAGDNELPALGAERTSASVPSDIKTHQQE